MTEEPTDPAGPASDKRARRLALLLAPGTKIVDPMRPGTWLFDGQPCSPDHFETLSGMTLQDAADALALMRFDVELRRSEEGIEMLVAARHVIQDARDWLHRNGPPAVE
jgi:hypothetical protein